MVPQFAMQKRISLPWRNALDNARIFRGIVAQRQPKSTDFLANPGHDSKRKRLCVFTTIATPI
jgi:hypothetical protein